MKAVKYVYRFPDANRVISPVSITLIRFHNLQNASRAKPFEWLRLRVFGAGLSQVKRESENIFHILGHGLEVFF